MMNVIKKMFALVLALCLGSPGVVRAASYQSQGTPTILMNLQDKNVENRKITKPILLTSPEMAETRGESFLDPLVDLVDDAAAITVDAAKIAVNVAIIVAAVILTSPPEDPNPPYPPYTKMRPSRNRTGGWLHRHGSTRFSRLHYHR